MKKRSRSILTAHIENIGYQPHLLALVSASQWEAACCRTLHGTIRIVQHNEQVKWLIARCGSSITSSTGHEYFHVCLFFVFL